MTIHGLPERFWIVLNPSPGSELVNVCVSCTFGRLIDRVRGGLHRGRDRRHLRRQDRG